MSLLDILYRILPRLRHPVNNRLIDPYLTSPFYRLSAGPWGPNGETMPAGTVHGGIDLQYTPSPGYANGSADPINANHPSVYAPVGGTIAGKETSWNAIVIGAIDGTYHRLGHMFTYAINPSTNVEYEKGDAVSVGSVVGREGDKGAEGAIHVHYDVFLESGGAVGYQGPVSSYADNQLDPIVYWTSGVNPTNASSATGTGLLAYATPVNDVNGNGIIDDPAPGAGTSEIGAVVKEGGKSYLKVGVNTPHTRAIELRIEFTGAPTGFRVVDRSGDFAVQWNDTEKAAYVTLPPTTNQSNPRTSTIIELQMAEDDDNKLNEFLTYTVTAGYLDANNQWSDFNQTATIFTPVQNQPLYILDNDVSTPPTAVNVITGDQSQAGYWDDIDAKPNTQAIYGLGGDDLLSGHSGQNGYVAPIAVYGGTGNDGMYGEYLYTSNY